MSNKIKEYLKNQINQSADYYSKWLYPKGYGENLYQINLTSLSYDNNRNYIHNCVPCNLHEGANLIKQFLENHRNCGQAHYFVMMYSLCFYLQAERLGVIYKELGYTKTNKGKEDFDWQEFPVLQTIKYWANFFKHPKSAILLHHTSYYIVSCPNNPSGGVIRGMIDFEFVKKYYSGSRNNSKLDELLSNNKYDVYYPDLVGFTKELCNEFEKIIQVINSNEESKEKLKKYQLKSH